MVNIILQRVSMRILGFMILMLISIFLFNGCNRKKDIDNNVVAEFGNGNPITFNELQRYVFDENYNKRYRVKSEGYKHALDDMLENKMKRVDFFESRLDTNKALIKASAV